MISRIYNIFSFFLERFILRGAHYRLLFIAAVICMVSFVGGYFAYLVTSELSSYPASVWWAFLRLTDPGYLGDDTGTGLRIVSTIITVIGYVVFMGSLIAIMTQWLNQKIKTLELGLTPIAAKGHVVILGWTNRTPTIVCELIRSEERLKRFLITKGARKLRIVILAEEVNALRRNELQEILAEDWDERQIILRTGTPLKNDDLMRVDFLNASAIIFPGTDFIEGGSEAGDMRTMKTLLSMKYFAEKEQQLPFLVTEIFDARKVGVSKAAYGGAIEIIPSDSTISLLIAQNVRHRFLSHIFNEVLTYGDGNEIRIRYLPQFSKMLFEDLTEFFPKAVPLGVLRPSGEGLSPFLNPPAGFEIYEDDRLVFLARSHSDTNPLQQIEKKASKRGAFVGFKDERKHRHVLILGWTSMIPALIHELDSYRNENFKVDILSRVPENERLEKLHKYALRPARVRVSHLMGDYGTPSDLEAIHPDQYDNILILGSDYFPTKEEADARSILGLMLLREVLKDKPKKPDVLLELVDPGNHSLFRGVREEVLISPMILSHMLAHVALRPDLNVVFQELFSSGGAEIYFRPVNYYGISGKTPSFRDIQEHVTTRGEIAIGVKINSHLSSPDHGISLNPAKMATWSFSENDEIVVLTTYA